MNDPECPGEDCPMCTGECCNLCGAGCWSQVRCCEHDVLERHGEPDYDLSFRMERSG